MLSRPVPRGFALLALAIGASAICNGPLAVSASGAGAVGELSEPLSFNDHIRPILSQHCIACHGGVKQASGVSFIYRAKATAPADSGDAAIVPGDPKHSTLMERVTTRDESLMMPPADHGPALTRREVELLRRWIEQGAEWEEHWSFVAPRRHSPPEDHTQWSRTPVDRFVLAKLRGNGLKPSAEGDKRRWLRRVSLDLVGLPPSQEQLDLFLNDKDPSAYEAAVDRLLASPHFGERWASVWLDLMRYADTQGYEADLARNVWPYRDWLIRALNADVPYDQFLVKQLAGDLLPDATLEDRLATTMHRNTKTNTEGGTDDEEFRLASIVDRVNTTWQAVCGLTFGCAQCHSHPYDPIEHEEYYQFLSLFNTSRDVDVFEEFPLLAVPNDPTSFDQADRLDRQISQSLRELHKQSVPVAQASEWTPVSFDKLASTGNTKVSQREGEDGIPELTAGGNISSFSDYTLEAPAPEGVERITGLRIEVLPESPEQALRIPEMGFGVSKLQAWVIVPGEKAPREVTFSYVIADDPEPIINPQESLRDGSHGWAAYTRLFRPRWAVFVLSQAIELPPGARLKLVIKQHLVATGMKGLVIRRGRFAVTSNSHLVDFIKDEPWRSEKLLLEEVVEARQKIASTPTPIIGEQEDGLKRQTYVFVRGNWLDKGERVSPGVPDVFPAMKTDAALDRLDLARWLVSADHPLTARIAVNRAWAQLFGIGIVETQEDFGASGLPPSHPDLLDDLAVRFRTQMHWSIKKLLRELVLSSAYRQTSRATDKLLQRDPRNRLLARGPRTRLSAEMVRDQALAVSGLLADKQFGPPVMPPQPKGIWRSVYNGRRWKTSKGEDRYRRAVYTYWKRTSGYPSMIAFDAPDRAVCSVRRIPTNTPLQALVTLNDPVYVECAQALANRTRDTAGDDPRDQIAWSYEQAACVPPSTGVLDTLVALYKDSKREFNPSDKEMKKLGESPDAYAMTIVASTILNLDAVLMK